MSSIFDSRIKPTKYLKNYFVAILSMILIVTGIIAFNAAFSNVNLIDNTEKDEKAVNPTFTLQHYLYFNDIDLSASNCNSSSPNLKVIDTSNNGSKSGGNIPTNGNEPSGKCIILEETTANTRALVKDKKFNIKTTKKLVPLFEEEQTDYKTNPRMKYMDRLYNDLDDYNKNYTLSEVWVLKDEKDSTANKTSTNESDWLIYKVPKLDGNKHNPDAILFTNNPENTKITKPDSNGKIQEAEEYTIYIHENSVIRLVYEPIETKDYKKTDVDFFDYNISDGKIYSSNSKTNPQNTSKQKDTETWYAYTKEAGINSAENYSGTGAKYAFGNTNAGSNLGDEKHGNNYINRSNSINSSGSSYGLVKNNTLSEDKTPVWNDGIIGPDLFSSKEVTGKVSYTNDELNMIFDRIGGTFILSDIVNNQNNKKLEDLENFKITYQNTKKTIYSNEFWPMDITDSWGTDGNDMKFGSKTYQTNRRLFGAVNGTKNYLPIADCEEDHNPYFGVSFQAEFTIDPGYNAPLDFFFFGDDDFWLFLEKPDGTITQIADIGGVHSSLGQYINLWDYVDKVPYYDNNGKPNKESGKYKLYFFYTERGASGSTLFMRFTIPLDSVKSKEQETKSLIIGKEVRGLEINDDAEYEFELTFTEDESENKDLYLYEVYNRTEDDSEGLKVASGVFKTENHKFKLKNNQYLVISGLPDTLRFKVREITQELDDPTKPTENRKISVKTTHKEGFQDHESEEKDGAEVECAVADVEYVQFFNSYTGITVTKEAFGDIFKDQEFEFTVTLSDNKITGKYGDMEFNNGKATFKLKSGETIQATNLPDKITYTVDETIPENDIGKLKVKKVNESSTTAYGTIDDVFIYNYYEDDLKIEKAVIGKGTKDYKFKLNLNIDDRISKDTYTYQKYKDDKVIETNTMPKTGTEITLEDGEYIIIKDLPISTKYTIEEIDSETSRTTYCKSSTPENCTDNISDGKKIVDEKLENTSYIKFTNYYSGVTVTKHVIGISDNSKQFNFTMTLENSSINGRYGDFEFDKGVAKFTLTNGETKQTSTLPENTKYTITEETEEGYKTIKVGDTGNTSYNDINVVEFYNYQTTKLKVAKEVHGLPESINKEYQFVLTLKNIDEHLKNEQASYIKYTTKDNKEIESSTTKFNLASEINFTLKNGEYIILNDLPDGYEYELTEKDPSASKVYYYKGSIEKDTESLGNSSITGRTIKNNLSTNNYIKFVNSYAGLTVNKKVIGAKGDKNKDFVFTVTLDNKNVNGTYGEMSFKNGIATFTLKHNKSKTAYGLPEGVKYKVEEQAETDYSATSENATGTIKSQGITTVNFYNYLTKRLKVEKEIVGTVANKDALYQFKFELDHTETGYPDDYKYIKYNQDDKAVSEKQTIKSGESFTLKGSEYVVIEGLPDNAVVTITETAEKVTKVTTKKGTIKNGLANAETDGEKITININDNNYIKFINKYASISVKKIILGKPEDMKKSFKFTVTLTNGEKITGKYGDIEFNNGVAEFKLTNEQIKIASGLPEGTTYKVTEVNQDGFQTIKTNDTGTLKLGETNEVVFINYTTGDIRIEKDYTFKFNINSDNEIKGSYAYTRYDKNGNEINSNSESSEGIPESTSSNTLSNNSTFTLKAGEYIILRDIETTAKVTIEEINIDATNVTISTSGSELEGIYETKIDGSKITTQGPYVTYIKFTNTYGGIDITKEVFNVRDNDKDKEFTFTITLNNKNINGKYGDLTFKDGVSTFTLKHDETKYTSGLPDGTTYEIVEQSIDGYKSYSTTNTGTIVDKEQQEVKFTNLRVLNLRIAKEVKGLLLTDFTDYSFNLHLDDIDNDMYAKKYTYKKYNLNDEEIEESTFKIGDNNFTLKDGEYIIIEDLPEIINYIVTEDQISNSSTDYIIGTTFAGLTENITTGLEYQNDVSSINNIKFINKFASIKFTKIVTGPLADYNRAYKFTIKLDDSSINGTYGDLTFENGVATFTLKNEETKYANALPENISYEVIEEPLEGYKVTSKGEKGITKYGSINEVEFTNQRTLIDYILPPNTNVRKVFDKYIILIINCLLLTIGLIARAIRKKILKSKKA